KQNIFVGEVALFGTERAALLRTAGAVPAISALIDHARLPWVLDVGADVKNHVHGHIFVGALDRCSQTVLLAPRLSWCNGPDSGNGDHVAVDGVLIGGCGTSVIKSGI